jgi:hypothetical protein
MIRVNKIVYPTPMMEAAGLSETSVHIYGTACRYIPEDGDVHILIGPTRFKDPKFTENSKFLTF